MSIDKVKQKLEELKSREELLSKKEDALGGILPIHNAVKGIKENIELLKNMIDSVERREDKKLDSLVGALDTEGVIEAIKEQTNTLKKDSSLLIVEEINKLSDKVGSLSLSKQSVIAIQEQIEKVINLLVPEDEVPNDTSYTWNRDNKIAKVVDRYDGFEVVQFWTYDTSGRLINVRTVRNEI